MLTYYDHNDGFEEFLPEDAPGSQRLEERRERRRRMREEIAAVHREADPTHPTSVIFHFIEAMEECVPRMRPGWVRIEPFGITPDFRAQADRSEWLL